MQSSNNSIIAQINSSRKLVTKMGGYPRRVFINTFEEDFLGLTTIKRKTENFETFLKGMKIVMDFSEANEEYEVVTSVPEKFLCETGIKSEASADNIPVPYYPESLESFREHPEIIGSQWIERIIQDTRPLTQWLKHEFEGFQNKYRGEAFVPCPVPHVKGDLPVFAANQDTKNYRCCGNQNTFTLETTLSKISKGKRGKYKHLSIDGEKKFLPEVIIAGSFMNDIQPEVAIENYCQQHAYSRARLLRTDRRELANELLELMSTDSDTSEINVAPSSRSASPPPNAHDSLVTIRAQFGNQRTTTSRKQAVAGAQTDATNASAYNLDRKDTKHLFDFHTTLSKQTDNATAAQSSVLCKDLKRKEATDWNTAQKSPLMADVNEPLKISPCVFLPNDVVSESRKKIIRRHKSVPRFTPKPIY